MNDFSQYIWNNYQQTHKISIGRQTKILYDYLSRIYSIKEVAKNLLADYERKNRKDNVLYIKEVLQ